MKKFSKLLCFMVVFITVMVAFCTVSFAADVQYTENLIPKMTSDTSPSGISSSNSVFTVYSAYLAFDRNTTSESSWLSWVPTNTWLAYEFPSPQIITKYTLTCNQSIISHYPANWTFDAWNGNKWIVLDTRTNITDWEASVKKEFYFNNSTAYSKYRININLAVGGAGNPPIITEMEMMASIVTAPAAPTNLTASPGDKIVSLSWSLVEGATSYNVKRSETPGGPYQTIATTTAGAISYSDTGLQNGTTYYYVVSAVNAGGESSNSNEASATPIAPQSTNQLKLVLEVKEEKQLSVSEELSDNTEMDWISSDPSIATIDANGKVKALKPGNAVITCTSKDKSYTESINVLVVDLEYQLAVDLSIGGTCRLTIDDLTNTTYVAWSSYDLNIATVSDKGKVTAVSEGLTYVTATDKDGKEIGRIYIRVRQ